MGCQKKKEEQLSQSPSPSPCCEALSSNPTFLYNLRITAIAFKKPAITTIMPKDSSSSTRAFVRRHNPVPLPEDLLAHDSVRVKPTRAKRRGNTHGDSDNEKRDAGGSYVDAGLSRKILRMAREQQGEIEDENGNAKRRTNGLVSPGGSSSGSLNGFSMMRVGAEEYGDDSEEEYDGDGFGEDEYEDVEEVVSYPMAILRKLQSP